MQIPDTLARKITAYLGAEKSMGAENFFVTLCLPISHAPISHIDV